MKETSLQRICPIIPFNSHLLGPMKTPAISRGNANAVIIKSDAAILAIRKFVLVHIRLFFETIAITAKFPNSDKIIIREYANVLIHWASVELSAEFTQVSFGVEDGFKTIWYSLPFRGNMTRRSGLCPTTSANKMTQ